MSQTAVVHVTFHPHGTVCHKQHLHGSTLGHICHAVPIHGKMSLSGTECHSHHTALFAAFFEASATHGKHTLAR